MSNSDFDSDGFESAEDDDFEIRQPTTRKHSDTVKPSKSDETAEKVKDSTDRNKSEAKTTEDGWNDDEDNWGWNDDSDNKKPAKASGSAQVTTTTAAADKLTNKVKALDVQDDWNDNEDNWGWNEDKNDSGFKSEPKPKLDNSQANADRPNAAALDVLQNRGQRNISESGLGQGTGVENAPAWSPWSGMVSFLSTASTNVASFTSHVSSVIESNIGVPDPELFAQQQASEKTATPATAPLPSANDETVATTMLQDEKLLNLGSFVSNMTSISNRVIAGGLDTLEGIGKKTMTILQENDAGLISKRRLLGLDNPKPVLSQILREAKEKSEEMEKTMNMSQKRSFRKQLHFETLFDDYHGLVHLEALEMLSKQASLKLQTLLMPLTGNALNELQQTMSSVNELCELNESDLDETPSLLYDATELDERLKAAVEDFDVPMDFTDILDTWRVNYEWLENTEEDHQMQQIHDNALKCLAKTTALAINKYHKLAELLLIKDHHNTVNESDCLVQLTNTFCWHLSGIATFHSDKLTNVKTNDPEIQTNNLITNIFLEGSKSSSYIQNGFQLFIPILQVGAV